MRSNYSPIKLKTHLLILANLLASVSFLYSYNKSHENIRHSEMSKSPDIIDYSPEYFNYGVEDNSMITLKETRVASNNSSISNNAFVSTWKTDNPGVSNNNQITIPTFSGETYDYNVDWGDGSSDTNVTGDISHTYASPGTYTVSITGLFPRIYFSGLKDEQKILTIENWGDNPWTSFRFAFEDCENLNITNETAGAPNLSNCSSLYGMFQYCTSLNADLSAWEVSTITDMTELFYECHSFNQDLSSWDVSNVNTMYGMFISARSFNQDLSSWNVSNVTDMSYMFENATAFNGNIGNWNVNKVESTSTMFSGASSFNQDISSWNVSNVQFMTRMFNSATSFNQDIKNWDVSSVNRMNEMFRDAIAFDQNIGDWDLTSLIGNSMLDMFKDVGLSTSNYDATIMGWATDSSESSSDKIDDIPLNVTFNGGGSIYCTSQELRQKLVSTYSWDITDSGIASNCTNGFITTWKTDNPGASNDNQITIPTLSGETYNYNVDWGDGSSDTNVTTDITHSYAASGIYTVSITGLFPRILFSGFKDNEKILTIEQWGDNPWTSFAGAFSGCINLNILNPLAGAPNLSNCIDLDFMFQRCSSLNADLSSWDVSNISGMSEMFQNAATFNQDLSSWDVSNVTTMEGMFQYAATFNQNLNSWNVSQVKVMQAMFNEAVAFNGNIADWDVSNVKDMYDMFYDAKAFNQKIGNWNVSNVEYMGTMFFGATSFNQDLGNWNVSNVNDMSGMFQEATNFNGVVNEWDTKNVSDLSRMFQNAISFNQSLENWNVSKVTHFNDMFAGAASFDQSLASWNLSSTSNMGRMFSTAGLSVANYDDTLIGWATDTSGDTADGIDDIPIGIIFDGGLSKFCNASLLRDDLVNSYNWEMYDGGKDPSCDFDSDGVIDLDDNCPYTSNSDQLDTNNNGIGDSCESDIDSDQDGVVDAFDLCFDTPLGTPVDSDGCASFILPTTNFSILIVDESCISANDGYIEITAVETLAYTATLISDITTEAKEFTDTLLFEGLSSGDYELCLTVENQPDFSRCYNLKIDEPESITVQSILDTQGHQLHLSLSGSNGYSIELNGSKTFTNKSTITLQLQVGHNSLTVTGDKPCQGSHSDLFSISGGILVYPNPIKSQEELSIYLGMEQYHDPLTATIYSLNGSKILESKLMVISGMLHLSLNDLPAGVYVVQLKEKDKPFFNHKIYKR